MNYPPFTVSKNEDAEKLQTVKVRTELVIRRKHHVSPENTQLLCHWQFAPRKTHKHPSKLENSMRKSVEKELPFQIQSKKKMNSL